MIFDTHTHYDDQAFATDREAVLASLAGENVGRIICVSADPPSLLSVAALAEQYPFAYAAFGIHPDHVGWLEAGRMDALRRALLHPRAVAVGEIGLDYHWNTENKACQEKWFRAQLALAKEKRLPVIIHSRDAAADTLRILREENAAAVGGVLHCYAYSAEQAREYADMGLFLGIGGVLTFRNAKKLVKTVQDLPLSCFLLETDCPYLTPVPHRGERNFSGYLSYVVRKIAEIKAVSEETVMKTTWENACRLFRMHTA